MAVTLNEAPDKAPISSGAPVLEMRHISKRFDATQALDDVSLNLYPGEVHALLGENGAGKSTLIKIMTGIYQPDQGEILLDGAPIRIASAMQAQVYGIAAIYQEPMIFPDLNVAENIFIGHRERSPFVRWRQMVREAESILSQLDVKLDVRMPARGLTLAAQQTVEIAKAISLKVRILIMDEPTASLSAHEVELSKAADAGIFSSQEKERWIAQVKRDPQSWSGVRFPGSALLAKIFRKLAETFPVASYLGWADGDRHIGNVRNV